MKRILAPIIVFFVFCSLECYASLYFWNPKHRPPISLEKALGMAEKALEDEGEIQRCKSVSLYGSRSGDGKSGAWNLFFVMVDGRLMHVFVNMEGKVEAQEWKNDDLAKYPRPKLVLAKNMLEIKKRFEELFKEKNINAEIIYENGMMDAKYNVRKYFVYEESEQNLKM